MNINLPLHEVVAPFGSHCLFFCFDRHASSARAGSQIDCWARGCHGARSCLAPSDGDGVLLAVASRALLLQHRSACKADVVQKQLFVNPHNTRTMYVAVQGVYWDVLGRGAILTCSVLSRPLACIYELSPRDKVDRHVLVLCPGSTLDVSCGLFTVVTRNCYYHGLLLQLFHQSWPDSTALLCWEDPTWWTQRICTTSDCTSAVRPREERFQHITPLLTGVGRSVSTGFEAI